MLRAVAILLLLPLNLLLWGTPVFLGGVVKLLTFGELRRKMNRLMPKLGNRWVQCNDLIFDAFLDTRWEVIGLEGIDPNGRYLVISNHVSWVDIFAIFRVFRRGGAPFVRFFLKQVLIWFPIAGQACWALGFPFMRRYTPEYLAHHPEKRGRDLDTTRKACRRYRKIPVTILNFVEGTRFDEEKHEDQQSPYTHLLRPRIGGIGFVIASLAEELDAMYDVTLIYPGREVTMWDFISNKLPWIKVRARRLEIPNEFHDAAITEPGPARDRFRAWIEELWREKDEAIAETLA